MMKTLWSILVIQILTRYKEITGSPAALPKPDNDVHFHVNLKSNVQSKTKQPLSESGSDYGNTFTIGKSFGTVRQNNFGGDQHSLRVGQGDPSKISQNNFGGKNHIFKTDVQSKTKQPLSESSNDYGNTFTIGKSFGTVRQNNFGGDQHSLRVGQGDPNKISQNNFGGKNHIFKIGQSGNDYGITNHGFIGGYGDDGKYKPVFECRSGEGVSVKNGFAICPNGKKMKIDCPNIKMNQNKVYCCPQCPKVNIGTNISRPCYPFCDGGIPGLNEKIGPDWTRWDQIEPDWTRLNQL